MLVHTLAITQCNMHGDTVFNDILFCRDEILFMSRPNDPCGHARVNGVEHTGVTVRCDSHIEQRAESLHPKNELWHLSKLILIHGTSWMDTRAW